MTLVQSWIDSLQLLRLKNLKLFVLVTLKSLGQAYKLVLRYFWWMMVICLVISLYRLVIVDAHDMVSLVRYAQLRGIIYLLYTLLFMGVCFVTRPSIAKKDGAYFRSHYKKIILYWIMWSILFTACARAKLFMPLFWVSPYSAWYIFTILFFADSAGGTRNFFASTWRALKMIIFNLPLLFIIGAFFYCSHWLFFYVIKRGIILFVAEEYAMAQALIYARIITNFLGVLLMPIGICTYANIYIKKLHDQFDLYIKQPQ